MLKSTQRHTMAATLTLLALAVAAPQTLAETRYYQIAEWPGQEHHFDSYILPLSDPGDMTHAQALIDQGPAGAGAAIVIAKISPGSDGINVDLNQPGHPSWSWHVTEFVEFADMSIELYDGWPQFVESDVPGWMANTNGTIGFWSYTVVADVTNQIPEPASLALLGCAAVCLLNRRAR